MRIPVPEGALKLMTLLTGCSRNKLVAIYFAREDGQNYTDFATDFKYNWLSNGDVLPDCTKAAMILFADEFHVPMTRAMHKLFDTVAECPEPLDF